ncbi:MAG: hypothetical protein ACE5NJ_12530 [Thermodesulfobacteriota bacterium]
MSEGVGSGDKPRNHRSIRENYDLSIVILRQALSAAKIGRGEKLKAMKRLAFLESGKTPLKE